MLYASVIQGAIDQAVNNQIYQIVLPFALIFLVTFVLLKSSKVAEDNIIAGLIAGVIALLVTLFLSSVPIVGEFLSFLLGKAGIIFVIVLIILVVNAFISKNVA